MISDRMTYILERKDFVKSDEKYMEYGPDANRDIPKLSKGVSPKLLDEKEKVKRIELETIKDFDTFMREWK